MRMDPIEQLKQDLCAGRINPEAVLAVLASLQRHLAAAQQRIAELEQQQGSPPPATAKLEQPFSVRAEEQRQEQRGAKKRRRAKKGRRGRLSNAAKIRLAQRTEQCFPHGVAAQDCWLSHTRPVWRLENGRATLVAYDIYRGPQDQYGQIPGVLGRSEFGLEIVVEIAHMVYGLGLSFDKVCQLLHFLQGLRVGKSQVDGLLRQLARHWQKEFDVLCTLLANSLVVHADATRWSLNSVWAFLSEKARRLFFGVPKDGATLEQVLDPKTFAGLLISDDAAVYENFSQAQKCWAHLLRQAIKLTLQEPDCAEYRDLTDRLLEIYRQARRVQRDRRLSAAGRSAKVATLEAAVIDLCAPVWQLHLPPLPPGPTNDYRLLIHEVMRLLLNEQLFTFVTAPAVAQPNGKVEAVSGTNNEAERTLRGAAQARQTGRTNKTLVGARRQTIVVSVLESLRVYLGTYTLGSVVAAIQRWYQAGESCFRRLLRQLHLAAPKQSVLDKVLPVPDGS
jgi:transposase